jgi:hypothetical protein
MTTKADRELALAEYKQLGDKVKAIEKRQYELRKILERRIEE